jgi:Carnosine N-methyltransferase
VYVCSVYVCSVCVSECVCRRWLSFRVFFFCALTSCTLGPLLYHYEDMSGEASLELSYEEIRGIIAQTGFTIVVSFVFSLSLSACDLHAACTL